MEEGEPDGGEEPALDSPKDLLPSLPSPLPQPLLRRLSGEQPHVRRPSGEQPRIRQSSEEQPLIRRPSGEQPLVRRPSGEQIPTWSMGEHIPIRSLGEQLPMRGLVDQPLIRRPSGEQPLIRHPSGDGGLFPVLLEPLYTNNNSPQPKPSTPCLTCDEAGVLQAPAAPEPAAAAPRSPGGEEVLEVQPLPEVQPHYPDFQHPQPSAAQHPSSAPLLSPAEETVTLLLPRLTYTTIKRPMLLLTTHCCFTGPSL